MEYIFLEKLNFSVSGKLNPSFPSVETTRRRRTENLNLKQNVNQSRTEVLPMINTRIIILDTVKGGWFTLYWFLLAGFSFNNFYSLTQKMQARNSRM